MRLSVLWLPFLVVLAGCSTDRRYIVSHEKMVDATIDAITEEAHIKAGEIKRTESEKDGGPITTLEAPYLTYSKIEAKIDSSGKNAATPELSVVASTRDYLHTRHKDFEWRIHELVLLKLRARPHGHESKPTSLPPVPPKTPQPAPASKP